MDTDTYLPISRINQFVYCPRRFWLVYIEDSMLVDAHMLEGILQHTIVHEKSSLTNRTTGFPVASERLRIAGIVDVIESAADGLCIVEHKRGSTRHWENDQLQVVAQAIALEETTGLHVVSGNVFSWTSHRRYTFPISSELRQQVEQTVYTMQETIQFGQRPPPISDTRKCKLCSVREVCQPALIRRLKRRAENDDLIRSA